MKEALTDLDQSILNRKEVEEEEEEEENMSDGRKPKEKRDKQSLYLDKKYLNVRHGIATFIEVLLPLTYFRKRRMRFSGKTIGRRRSYPM